MPRRGTAKKRRREPRKSPLRIGELPPGFSPNGRASRAKGIGTGLAYVLGMSPIPATERTPKLGPAIVVEPVNAVDYAADAVVSRALVSGKAGSVTLFAFDRGQQLSEHTAPFDALVQVLDGEAQLTIGEKLVRARAGQMVLMPAGVPHAVKAPERFKMLLIMIRN